MGNKLTDLRDVVFILYEQLKIDELCRSEQFREHSRETFDMIIKEAERLAVNDFAPVNREGDRVGCIWKDGKVRVPEAFHSPFRKYCEGGWISMPEDCSVGGQNVPMSVYFACNEVFFAANHSLAGYMGLTHSAAKVIEVYGTEEQKRKYMQPLYDGRYAGTMVLTENQAGSDVGAVNTKAIRNPDGTYSIVGGKIFITGGEHDLTENIIHIVLARIEGHPRGTQGLSCFIVPKAEVHKDGSTGEYNDVTCTGIEHKMGMNGSATCVLSFGDNGKCKGELLGPPQKGINVMFHMMNEQRLLVGLQGLAQASTAYLHALEFAKERKQGSKFGSKSIEQVPILDHPDVRRQLLWMKSYTEGMRALVLFVAYCMDMVATSNNEVEKRKWQDRVDVLTPVCKAYCTDRGFEVCVRSIQVHGGYGYSQEYPVEQFARDCKVTSIYEGTNGIQALDLFGRKIRMRDGAALEAVISKMNEDAKEALGIKELAPYAGEVSAAISKLQEITMYLLKQASSENAYLAYSWATPYLEIFGDTVLGWLFIWQARAAYINAATNIKDTVVYENKINTAKFYISSLLPLVHGKIDAVRKNDHSFLNMGEAFFH